MNMYVYVFLVVCVIHAFEKEDKLIGVFSQISQIERKQGVPHISSEEDGPTKHSISKRIMTQNILFHF